MSFVTVKLKAGMANQMFQIATCIAHALRHDAEYKIPHLSTSRVLPEMPFPHLPNWTPADGLGPNYVERGFHYQELPYWPKMRLEGYFQSARYFENFRDEIIEAFRIPWLPMKGVVGIHVRRGDYLQKADKHPPVSAQYIITAMTDFVYWGYEFLFFSDDIQWCRKNFPGQHYSEGKSPLDDLSLLSSCEHQIISNSTFSWMAAWLNQNPDKIVITPHEDNWYGPANKHINTSSLIPQEWIRIKF